MSRTMTARTAEEPPTPSEIRVLESVTLGFSYAGTAARLNLSTATVKHHLRRMRERYGLTSTAHLVATAFRQGWVA